MSAVLAVPQPPHRHLWPTRLDGDDDTRENTVGSCRGCGRLLVVRVNGDGYLVWVPLRWWHRRARHLLAAALADEPDVLAPPWPSAG